MHKTPQKKALGLLKKIQERKNDSNMQNMLKTWQEHCKCLFVGLKMKCSCTFVPFLSHYMHNNPQCHTHIRKALFKSFPLMCILILFISYIFDEIASDRDHFNRQKSKIYGIKKATFLFKAISLEPFMPPASATPQ